MKISFQQSEYYTHLNIPRSKFSGNFTAPKISINENKTSGHNNFHNMRIFVWGVRSRPQSKGDGGRRGGKEKGEAPQRKLPLPRNKKLLWP